MNDTVKETKTDLEENPSRWDCQKKLKDEIWMVKSQIPTGESIRKGITMIML